MAKICLSLTEKTLAMDLEVLEKYRKYVDIAELRVDCLDPDERLLIRRFPEMAGIPVILSVRRGMDGGSFFGGEGARIMLLATGLAYAETDRRRNFAYVDLEEDLNVPGLEEAARTFGTRIIRSWYNLKGVDGDLEGKIRKLKRVGDELIKILVTPCSLQDIMKVYQAAKKTRDISKAFICLGEYGFNSGILAELLDSQISYTLSYTSSGEGEDRVPLSLDRMDPKELVEFYRFREITKETKIFASAGYPISVDDAPRFFNQVFKIEKTDAVSIPIPADSAQSILLLAELIGITGISVTDPYKEDILSYLAYKSPEAAAIGACDTVIASSQGWMGYNTDAAAFSDSLLAFLERKDLRGWRITIVGASGVASAVASEVHRLKGKALILNRTVARARILAEPYRFAWAGLGSRGTDLIKKYSHIIILNSSASMDQNKEYDPLEFYKFNGKEVVIDLAHKMEKPRCRIRAEEAGCRVLNGYNMLLRQACYQYTHFMNKEFPPSLLSRMDF